MSLQKVSLEMEGKEIISSAAAEEVKMSAQLKVMSPGKWANDAMIHTRISL